MLEKYQTGRGTLREALRLLEFQGVITLKPGPRGGPVLMDPDASHLASNLVLLMQLKAAPFRNIVEVRTAMEPMISSLAAERMDDDALTDLEGTITRCARRSTTSTRSSTPTSGSTTSSRGPRATPSSATSSTRCPGSWTARRSVSTTRAIAVRRSSRRTIEIFEALKARDPKASEARMREHIDAYERYAARKFPQVLKETIPWEQRYFA